MYTLEFIELIGEITITRASKDPIITNVSFQLKTKRTATLMELIAIDIRCIVVEVNRSFIFSVKFNISLLNSLEFFLLKNFILTPKIWSAIPERSLEIHTIAHLLNIYLPITLTAADTKTAQVNVIRYCLLSFPSKISLANQGIAKLTTVPSPTKTQAKTITPIFIGTLFFNFLNADLSIN